MVICNGDDDLLRALDCRQRKMTFGLSEACDVRAEDVRDYGTCGSECTIVLRTCSFDVRFRRMGRTWSLLRGGWRQSGSLLASRTREILIGIVTMCRWTAVRDRTDGMLTVVNDCYNANPDSTVLRPTLAQQDAGARKVA